MDLPTSVEFFVRHPDGCPSAVWQGHAVRCAPPLTPKMAAATSHFCPEHDPEHECVRLAPRPSARAGGALSRGSKPGAVQTGRHTPVCHSAVGFGDGRHLQPLSPTSQARDCTPPAHLLHGRPAARQPAEVTHYAQADASSVPRLPGLGLSMCCTSGLMLRRAGCGPEGEGNHLEIWQCGALGSGRDARVEGGCWPVLQESGTP